MNEEMYEAKWSPDEGVGILYTTQNLLRITFF